MKNNISNLTRRDLDDAMLAAKAKYAEFKKKYEEEVNKPDEDLKNSMAFRAMPPATKEQWKEADPESYRLANKQYGGK